jgi:hypothetical protein
MKNKNKYFNMMKFNLISFPSFIILILTIFSYNNLLTQTYTNKIFGDASIRPDSLFVNFEYPKIPQEIYDIIEKDVNGEKSKYSFYSFTIFCTMTFNNNDSLIKIMCKTIYNYCNNIPEKHKIWKKLISTIKNVSKKWKVKKLLWEIDENNEDKKLIEYYKKSNEGKLKPTTKPSFGNQIHCMILEYSPFDEEWVSSHDFVYKIKIRD